MKYYIPPAEVKGKWLDLKFKIVEARMNNYNIAQCICEYLSIIFKYGSAHFSKKSFENRFLCTKSDGTQYFNFCGAKLPDITYDPNMYGILKNLIFGDTFLIPCYYGNNFGSEIVESLDAYMAEGPYGYSGKEIDVSVKKGDCVIDAGAWIGDFSAYAAAQGATCYAFEPNSQCFKLLEQTALLNKSENLKRMGEGVGIIIPICLGLSNTKREASLSINIGNSSASSLSQNNNTKTIQLVTLDEFVLNNNIQKVDFIKSDIEGEERNMLNGARNILREYGPKLAICTYHLPDDPEILKTIIMESNPKYQIVQLRHKLYASIVK
jgi:FkbM family methyltransferase